MALDEEGIIDNVDGEEEVSIENGQVVQLPKALPTPKVPSKKEVDFHNLTHIPYRNWCPFCVRARRKNDPHCQSQGDGRSKPLFCADYCFVRETEDEGNLSLLVGRIKPGSSTIVVPCQQKGHDDYAVHRVRAFFKAEGHASIVYKSDQERAIKRLLDDVVTEAKQAGDVIQAVPENSAVGESQSNGLAERSVGIWEDQFRTRQISIQRSELCRLELW